MATADALIQRDGPVTAPLDYVVPTGTEIQPLVVTATFDGSAASEAFVPVLEVIAPNGGVVARCPLSTQVAALGSADVSWFPWRRGLSTSSTPAPTPLGTLIAWYDFSLASSITLDGSGRIQQINDLSGNAHHAIQATAARRPGQTTVNALSAGLFTSSRTTALNTSAFTSPYSQPVTICYVVTQTIAGAGAYWPGFIATLPLHNNYHVYVHHNENYVVMQVDGGAHIDSGVISPFSQTLFSHKFAGASSYMRVNGVQINGSVDNQTFQGLTMGTQFDGQIAPGETDFMDGAFCELLAYSGALTTAQLTATEQYLRAKWGTP